MCPFVLYAPCTECAALLCTVVTIKFDVNDSWPMLEVVDALNVLATRCSNAVIREKVLMWRDRFAAPNAYTGCLAGVANDIKAMCGHNVRIVLASPMPEISVEDVLRSTRMRSVPPEVYERHMCCVHSLLRCLHLAGVHVDRLLHELHCNRVEYEAVDWNDALETHEEKENVNSTNQH